MPETMQTLRADLTEERETVYACMKKLKEQNAEIERLRSWMYEAINSLADPQDACDHDDSEESALRATIDEAIGKLRTALADEQSASQKREG